MFFPVFTLFFVSCVQSSSFIIGGNSKINCVTNETTGLVWNLSLEEYDESISPKEKNMKKTNECENIECFEGDPFFVHEQWSSQLTYGICRLAETFPIKFILRSDWEELQTYVTPRPIRKNFTSLTYYNDYLILFSIRASKSAEIRISDEKTSYTISLPSATNQGVVSFHVNGEKNNRSAGYHHINFKNKDTHSNYSISPYIWKHFKLSKCRGNITLRSLDNNGGEQIVFQLHNVKELLRGYTWYSLESIEKALWKVYEYDHIVTVTPGEYDLDVQSETGCLYFIAYMCHSCTMRVNSNNYTMDGNRTWIEIYDLPVNNTSSIHLFGSDVNTTKDKSGVSFLDRFWLFSRLRIKYKCPGRNEIRSTSMNYEIHKGCNISCQNLMSEMILGFKTDKMPPVVEAFNNTLNFSNHSSWISDWINNHSEWRNFVICDDQMKCSTAGTFNASSCILATSDITYVYRWLIGSVTLLLIFIVAVLFCIYWKCRKAQTHNDVTPYDYLPYPQSFRIDNDELTNPIKIQDFDNYVQDTVGELETEFRTLVNLDQPYYIEVIDPGIAKRAHITLYEINDNDYKELSYSSYIDTYKIPKFFITTDDVTKLNPRTFWKIVWQENVRHIICLDDDFNGMHTFIASDNKFPADLTIVPKYKKKTQSYDSYLYQVNYKGTSRDIKLIHFNRWQDHIPLCSQNLIECLQLLLKLNPKTQRPVFIYCSVNVNRIGTLVICDYALRQGAHEGIVDILNAFYKLHKLKPSYMKYLNFYKLIHVAVNDVLTNVASAEISCSELRKHYKYIMSSDFLTLQLLLLKNCLYEDEDHLYANTGMGKIGLHNLVLVDDFRTVGKFLITQYPEKIQVEQFWTYVSNNTIPIIVSLNESISENVLLNCFYIQRKNTEEYNDFVVIESVVKVSRNITHPHTVKVIQFKNWPAKEVLPPDSMKFLSFLRKTIDIHDTFKPVMVLCCDGIIASGLYVGLSYVINNMRFDQKCNIPKAVMTVRREFQAILLNEAQLRFLYDSAHLYIKHFEPRLSI